MKTLVELKNEAVDLANQGLIAARARDFSKARAVQLQLDPLLRELGTRLADQNWNELADEGNELMGQIEKSGLN